MISITICCGMLCARLTVKRERYSCPRVSQALAPTCPSGTPYLLLQLGGLVGLAVSLLYFLQEKIVSAAAAAARVQALSSCTKACCRALRLY